MIVPLFGMLAVITTWCLLAIVFFGLGQLVFRALRLNARGWRYAHLSFWVGWASSIVLLQLWHLQFPVDARLSTIVAGLGVAGVVVERKAIIAQCKASWRQRNQRQMLRAAVVITAVILFWSALAVGVPHRPDTANYHLAGVRWASAYPVVPGLGNLHHRLAFNNSSFLYAAMLDVGPWTNKSHHLAHGLLAIVTILYFLSYVPRVSEVNAPRFPLHLLHAFFLPIAVLFTYKGTTSLQPDFITFLIGLIVASLLFELLLSPRSSGQQVRRNTFAICFLSAVGLTVKVSLLPFGFLASCIALGYAWRQDGSSAIARRGLLLMSSFAAALAIVPWVGRNLILSGYPLYPSTFGSIDVLWRVPLADVQIARDKIVGYARMHGEGYLGTLDNYEWVGPVIIRELSNPICVTLPMLCVVIASFRWCRDRQQQPFPSRATSAGILFFAPAIAAILFMMVTAPCTRFAGAAIWVLATGAMVLTIDRVDRSTIRFRRDLRIITVLGVGLFAVGAIKASRYTYGPIGDSAFAPIPSGTVRYCQTESGLQVLVSAPFAWDAPLPNTPEFRPNLALINKDEVSYGFKIEPRAGTPSAKVAGDLRLTR